MCRPPAGTDFHRVSQIFTHTHLPPPCDFVPCSVPRPNARERHTLRPCMCRALRPTRFFLGVCVCFSGVSLLLGVGAERVGGMGGQWGRQRRGAWKRVRGSVYQFNTKQPSWNFVRRLIQERLRIVFKHCSRGRLGKRTEATFLPAFGAPTQARIALDVGSNGASEA
jgi:hypothetical protein